MKNAHESYLPDARSVVPRRHTAVDQVHEILLEAIRTGELVAGDALNDQAWATRLTISRTPIREAIKRLEGHGIVSIAAARFTRVISFTKEQARQEARDWAAIHLALVNAVAFPADRALLADLEAIHERAHYVEASQHSGHAFAFFERLRAEVTSFSLHLGATAVAYRFQLARPALAEKPSADAALCADVVAALKANSTEALSSAFAQWTETFTQK